MATTMKANTFIPQVVADRIATEYGNAIVVSNYFDTNTDLVGNAGDTLSFPQWTFGAQADVIDEADPITPRALSSAKVDAKVVKIVSQIELTDEVLNSSWGDPYGEATEQIGRAIAIKDDADAITCLLTASRTATGASLDKAILNGKRVLGEKGLNATIYCFCNTADYYDMLGAQAFIPASQMLAEKLTKGVVGEYLGVSIIPTDTVTAKAPILMIAGAGKKIMKAGFVAEQDRDLSNHTWLLDGSEHRVMYLYNDSKVVKLTIA